MKYLPLLAALLVSSCAQSAPKAERTSTASPDEAAHFLAGLPVTGPLEPLTQTPAWRNHAAAMQAAWQRMEERQLSKVRVWANGLPTAKTLHYFFSGPDFLYADALFPEVSTYVLCAIEPVGAVNDLTRLDGAGLDRSLGGVRQSLSSILRFHYFITKELRVDLAREQLGGTLPLLYVFLARSGATIKSVTPMADGVKIAFRSGHGGNKTLYYFRTDLSNGANNAAFFDFCRKSRGAVSLLKAASYLLHEPRFSKCRDFLLENSSAIVQDDSGIPYRAFDPAKWDLRLWGAYRGTHGDFAKYHQPDLLAAFKAGQATRLDFAFGYQPVQTQAALIIARKK